MSLFDRVFSPLKKYRSWVKKINDLEKEVSFLSDEELKKKSLDLKEKIQLKKVSLEEALPQAFALVREAAKRTLGQRHYDVQLMGGIALFEGKIAEMATGEGKTLAATAPAYLYGLTGKGVHVVTVNDYLAQRDAVWMGQIYNFLGLTVGCLSHDAAYLYDADYKNQQLDKERDTKGSFEVVHEFLRPVSRKEAYLADVLYGTNHEFGFDYLRDNLAYHTADQVQRRLSQEEKPFFYAIIDEVDSILIDEARTPLIISAPDTQAADYYKVFAKVVSFLKKDEDYLVDEKNHFVQITEAGISKVEKMLNLKDLYGPQNIKLVHYLEESLKAKALFFRDKHYIVKNGEVVIVDEFTGRLMYGRRYSGGLHQALEAKEGVKIQEELKTFAQITIQNYFRLYQKIAGMTGTALTSKEEFEKVYGLEVVVIPPNKPLIRKDHPDFIFKTKEIKYRQIVEEVKKRVKKGQPVLVGTTSIEENETLSLYFSRAGIKHQVLNAKNHEKEAEIIAQAGRKGAVTLATNMAGRGVDIILGGNPPDPKEAEEVRKAGGLFVLGTNRHEARRIDNQLRGRAGRQGDPGETQFFLSLEDDLLRIFGGERIQRLMSNFNFPEDQPIQSSLISKVVDEAQKKVEGINFDIRKHLFEFDTVLNKQRQTIYRRRQNLLERIEKGETIQIVKEFIGDVLFKIISEEDFSFETKEEDFSKEPQESRPDLSQKVQNFLLSLGLVEEKAEPFKEDELEKIISEKIFPDSLEKSIEAKVLADNQAGLKILASLDFLWTNHLENLEALLEGVRIRAYGQKDPLVEYKREGFEIFKSLIIQSEILALANIFTRTVAETKQTVVKSTEPLSPSVSLSQSSSGSTGQKVGRNDPCPCGSGKKYKKCHGV
ncbi:MAG: preprotein translocase subunit SecA [Patescibacteria group bacterium]|nr:preprotein translocase subunit SecA [Patescibacteria group bacterium]